MTETYRDVARRQHRLLATYAAIQCWVKHTPAVTVGRTALETYFELERFTETRISWIKEDSKPWFRFPHQYYWGEDALVAIIFSSETDEALLKPIKDGRSEAEFLRLHPDMAQFKEDHASAVSDYMVGNHGKFTYAQYYASRLSSYLDPGIDLDTIHSRPDVFGQLIEPEGGPTEEYVQSVLTGLLMGSLTPDEVFGGECAANGSVAAVASPATS